MHWITATATTMAVVTLTAGCRSADHTEPAEHVHSGRLTPTEAQTLLLEADDLPKDWRPEDSAVKRSFTSLDTTGLSPASCASAWARLDTIQQQWDGAPIQEKTTYQNSDGALVTHSITNDPSLEPEQLRHPLDQLPEACASYQVTRPDGSAYTGGIKVLDLSRDNIGLAQTWGQPDGTLTDVYFAYIIRHTTVITVRTDGSVKDPTAFLEIVEAATKKVDQATQT
ncbi:hypothetical protein OG984_02465 [Nocardioides sp. NBC_00368]|nr:hypothetical protein [Nocardioides sp.]